MYLYIYYIKYYRYVFDNITNLKERFVEYIGYHGTNATSAEDIIGRDFKSPPLISQELRKSRNYKLPGSLGYGLYTFNSDPELAEEFSKRFNDDDVKVVKIKIDVDEEEIFDLDLLEQMKKLRKFYRESVKRVERNINGKKINDKKQNIFDGILLEDLFFKIRTHKDVKAVKMATHTFLDTDDSPAYTSRVHNGQEICIRDYTIIKTIEYYNQEEEI